MASRTLPILRAPVERVNDWNEFHTSVAESTLREQAGRCMDCGIPFCHTGELLNGAAAGCPLNNLIPDWNDLVSRGNWKTALERLIIPGRSGPGFIASTMDMKKQSV